MILILSIIRRWSSWELISKIIFIVLVLFISFFYINYQQAQSAVSYPAGSLLTTIESSAVYYISDDSKKYVFPDLKTYLTWYSDFSNVIDVTVADLDLFADGGVAPYRAGIKLITHPNTAKIYAVEPGGVLRWLPSAQIAENLYGQNWAARVQDIIPGYFGTSYVIASDISDTLPDGAIVTEGSGQDYFYIYQGTKRRFVSEDAFDINRLNFDNVLVVSDLSGYASGQPISREEKELTDPSYRGSIVTAGLLPIFPGAEGFGTDTVAGRGGTVLKISSLEDDAHNPDTLRWAINQPYPRVIVFEVSGYIDLNSNLKINEPYLTIAGQTAPDPGITIRNFQIQIRTSDVLIQHLRVRPGDYVGGSEPGNRDAINIVGGPDIHNIVLDHISMSWAIDETFSMSGSDIIRDVTISNSIIAQALDDSLHVKAPHSMGVLLTEDIHNVAMVKNLIMANASRNPKFGGNNTIFYANNVIYNARWWLGDIYDPFDDGPSDLTIVGNVGIKGIDTRGLTPIMLVQGGKNGMPIGTRIYANDNICPSCTSDNPWTAVRDESDYDTQVFSPPIWPDNYNLLTAKDTENYIQNNVGAYPRMRDEADISILNDLKNRTGQIIDCVTPNPLYFPTGIAVGGSTNTIVLSSVFPAYSKFDDRYNLKNIEIIAGTGSGQIRQITDYAGASRVATVSSAWGIIPDDTSQYRIITDCSKNAGGWPTLAENYRALAIPSNPNGDDDGDGYTNLEEWLHSFYSAVQ